MDPDDVSAAPDLTSATAAGAHEGERPGAATAAPEPSDGEVVPAESAEPSSSAPLEADEARLLGGVNPDAIATDAPDAGTQAWSGPARLGTDAPATPGTDGPTQDASSSLPSSRGQLVAAAGNSLVKRAVPLVSLAAIGALIFRSLRRRSR